MSDSNRGPELKKLPRISARDENAKQRRRPDQRRHGKMVQVVARTPEEEKIYQANKKKAQEEAQLRAKQIGGWANAIEKMSYRQIRGELRRIIRSGQILGEPTTPINIAEAVCLSITFETTKMRDNLAGQLSAVLNPAIAASSPRHTL